MWLQTWIDQVHLPEINGLNSSAVMMSDETAIGDYGAFVATQGKLLLVT